MVLDRYIAKNITLGSMLAALIMMLIFAFVDYISQLDNIGTGDYGALQAAIFVILRLPQRLYELSPSILLLGGILSMGALAANSELIVMRASGITILRITRSVMQIGLLIALLVALLGEFVVPVSTKAAKAYRAEAMEEKLIVGGTSDLWARDGNRYVNVKTILPDHQLRDIRVYEIDEQRQLSTMVTAEKAWHNGEEWILEGVSRSDISTGNIFSSSEQRVVFERLILLELFTVLELESKDMSARELHTYNDYLQDNNIDSAEYRLEFWIKILMPLTCLAMLLIAMPIVLSTTPRSGGAGQRIILAILIGVIYYVVNRSMNHLGLALEISPLLSASLPLLLVTVISLFFLQRIN